MPEETKVEDVKQTAPVPAGTQEPATQAQPTPVAKPGEPSKPEDVKQEQHTVPLPALQEERSKRQSLESELADLRRVVEQQQANVTMPPPPQPHQVDPMEELEKTWEENPKQAVRMEIMYAMDWHDRINANLDIQADQLARKYPDFGNYRSTAIGQVRSLPLNQRGGQGILEAAYFMVRGQNTDTLLQQREAELLEKYRRGEINVQGLAQPPGSFSAPPPAQGVSLSDEQQRVANAMGLSQEEYASQIKGEA